MPTAQTFSPAPTFTVYYRTGGPDRCVWREVFERYATTEEAQAKCADLGRAGYKALYEKSGVLERLGLPEGWDAKGVGREFSEARRSQGFRSQEQLDAFYAAFDHTQNCPVPEAGGAGLV